MAELGNVCPVDARTAVAVPLYGQTVHAGFPSPADDYIERSLDFNEYLVAHPAATFCVRVAGDSMTGARIFAGDILVVDRSLAPRPGRIVVAVIDGELAVKRLEALPDGRLRLVSANPAYPPLFVSAEGGFTIWGVVTGVVRRFAP